MATNVHPGSVKLCLMMNISNKIIVGVTGGIAAYKSPILIRRLKDRGATIKAVMTPGAKHFITPLTLQAVSGQAVRDSLLDADAESGMDHIDLARWADTIIVAPATADFIAKLAHGFADDLLSTLCLATTAKIYVAPAMNQRMWENKATQENIARIAQNGIHILGPDEGDQACGETGQGRMLEPLAIIEGIFDKSTANSNNDSGNAQSKITNQPTKKHESQNLSGNSVQANIINPNNDTQNNPKLQRILITAGPTWEALDPVRGITNHSSGKMGYSIAQAFSTAGYSTTLISGPTALEPPADVNFVNILSAQQMHDAVHRLIETTDIFISVAAVADYRPELVQAKKIKKSQDTMQINMVRNPDILKSVTALDKHPFTVGFAAETDNVIDHAKSKLANKKLDMIIANEVGNGKAFNQPTNELIILTSQNEQHMGPDSKLNLANKLVRIITEQYEKKHPT